MKIIKYKKDKNNTYKVYIDDEIISLYDDVIIKYNLLYNKNIEKKLFDKIIEYNRFLDGYYKAIKYINKKMRTELEIEKYLNKLNIKENDIKDIIKLLYKDGYLNKEIYMKAYINDQFNLTNNGPLKVKNDLIKLGYNELEINDYIESLEWNNKINKIINKKIKIYNKLSNNALKTKVLNDIIKIGYEKENIISYLENIEFESDTNNLTKEFNKIYNKYQQKYNGIELEYKIINYLYKKGYNIEDIKRCINENKI